VLYSFSVSILDFSTKSLMIMQGYMGNLSRIYIKIFAYWWDCI